MNISSYGQAELIYQLNACIQAVNDNPEIKNALKNIYIHQDLCSTGLGLMQEVKDWQQKQEACHLNSQKAQQSLKQLRHTIDKIYLKHKIAARFVYRENMAMSQKLRLHAAHKTRFADWLLQLQDFYDHLPSSVIVPFGILKQEVQEVKKLVNQLHPLQMIRDESKRQSQQATERKRKAILKLRQWFRYFIRTLEMACKDQPHLLEVLGIVY